MNKPNPSNIRIHIGYEHFWMKNSPKYKSAFCGMANPWVWVENMSSAAAL